MLLPGRDTFDPQYRFGFNGKENDLDFREVGRITDYGMRSYDARLGRFQSIDPLLKDYPWYTPYQFAGNSPLRNNDLDGAEENSASTYVHRPIPVFSMPRKNQAENSSRGMNLGAFKLEKQSYENTSWVSLNPFQPTKFSTFSWNVQASAWNQGVGTVEFSFDYLTSKQYRKKFENSINKALWDGLMWVANSDRDQKWKDTKDLLSDVNNWEDLGGTLLLGKMTANFSFKQLTPVVNGFKTKDVARVGNRLLGLSDRNLNDLEVRIFGSYVKGSTNPGDLDILILTEHTELFKEGTRLNRILEQIDNDFYKETGKHLDVNVMKKDTFRRAGNGEFKADVDKSSIKLKK